MQTWHVSNGLNSLLPRGVGLHNLQFNLKIDLLGFEETVQTDVNPKHPCGITTKWSHHLMQILVQ